MVLDLFGPVRCGQAGFDFLALRLALRMYYGLHASLVFLGTQPFDSGMGVFTLKSVRSFSRPLWERRLSSPGRLLLFLRTELTAGVLITGAALAGQASIALALRKLGDRGHLLNLLVTQLKKKVRLAPHT